MTMQRHEANPFTPTFGQVPANMAGRDSILREMGRALDAPTRSPELTTLISGARGSGKTALLARIAGETGARGWVAVSTVAASGMLEDIFTQAVDKSEHLIGHASGRGGLTGIGIAQILNVEWERGKEPPENWRLRMQKLTLRERDVSSGEVSHSRGSPQAPGLGGNETLPRRRRLVHAAYSTTPANCNDGLD